MKVIRNPDQKIKGFVLWYSSSFTSMCRYSTCITAAQLDLDNDVQSKSRHIQVENAQFFRSRGGDISAILWHVL